MLGNLKRWGEHEPFAAEDKYGAFRTIRPKHIVVTSNYHPRDLWPEDKELEPILRRFKIVKLVHNYYPEGHKNYRPEVRANALYPGERRQEQQEDSVAALV